MLKLITNPVEFFSQLKNRQVNVIFPIFLIVLAGVTDSIVMLMGIENITLAEVFLNHENLLKSLRFFLVSNMTFYIITILQIIFFPMIIKKLGGSGGSKNHSLYIIGIATMPIIIQSIIHSIFPGTILWNIFVNGSILYYLSYSIFNVFNIWSVALLIIGFAKVYSVSYKKASLLYVQFLLKLVPLAIVTFML